MRKIRPAKIDDADRVVELAHQARDESPVYRRYEVSEPKFRRNLAKMSYSKRHYVRVLEIDDYIQGFLMGLVAELPFGTEKQAHDWAFFVSKESRGHAPYLIRDFLNWAWAQPGVVEVGLSNSSGAHIEQTEALYSRMGLYRIGGIWLDKFIG